MMHPDGGIARFRVYGSVVPIFPDPSVAFDLAHSFNGGRCVAVSDQHYGVGANLLLSGRGKDMGDGWETKRSRTPGHTDWVIVKLSVCYRYSAGLPRLKADWSFTGNVEEHQAI